MCISHFFFHIYKSEFTGGTRIHIYKNIIKYSSANSIQGTKLICIKFYNIDIIELLFFQYSDGIF